MIKLPKIGYYKRMMAGFSPLRLLGGTSVGIDIADHTIEIIELKKKGSGVVPVSAGRAGLAAGVVVGGRIKDHEQLRQAVQELALKAQPQAIELKNIHVGLPESQVFAHVFELDSHSKKDRDKLILQEAQKSIPIESRDLLFSYKAREDGENVEVVLVATSRTVALEWREFWRTLALSVEEFDVESIATRRGLLIESPDMAVCVVDVGAAATNIAVFDPRGLRLTNSVNVAGDAFTQSIAEAVGINAGEAEKAKRSVGLSDPQHQAYKPLTATLEKITAEITAALQFYKRKSGQGVGEILLVGGSSQMPGLVDYLSQALGSVKLGQSVLGSEGDGLYYIGAIGLALRGLDKQWSKRDPTLPVEDLSDNKKKTSSSEVKQPKQKVAKDDAVVPTTGELDQAKKLRRQKIILVGILVVGVVLVGSAYWYRRGEKQKRMEELEGQAINFTQVQPLNVTVPLAVEESENTPDRVRGRKVASTVAGAGNYAEAQSISRIEVEAELQQSEVLWLKPVSPEQSEFPMTIEWIVFNEESANSLFEGVVEQMIAGRAPYSVSNIEKTGVIPTDNPGVFSLEGTVTVALNELLEDLVEEKPADVVEEPAPPEVVTVVVTDTPTGSLNVRSGSDITAKKIGEIAPGEEYVVKDEQEEWYQIELSDGSDGWVAKEYVSIKK